MSKLKGLICIVTGGAGSLGQATVKKLLQSGCKVAMFDLPQSKGQNIADQLGDGVVFQPTDVTNEQEVIKGLEIVKNKFGKLNVLVNCVGVGTNIKIWSHTSKLPHDKLEFQKIINTNLIGTFNVIRLACEMFSINKPGQSVIINTSSISAIDGMVGQVAYAASNAAINSMTLPLSR